MLLAGLQLNRFVSFVFYLLFVSLKVFVYEIRPHRNI
ncbi:elongation factor 4 [Listeria monocytogenes]|nr:elongation factor 4 [Listeria monocytogenes]